MGHEVAGFCNVPYCLGEVNIYILVAMPDDDSTPDVFICNHMDVAWWLQVSGRTKVRWTHRRARKMDVTSTLA